MPFQIFTSGGVITTRSSPNLAMSPPADLTKLYKSSIAFRRVSISFWAMGVIRTIRIMCFLASSLIESTSLMSFRVMALR